MTSFDESTSCTTVLHNRDSPLAIVEFELGSLYHILYKLTGIHCHRNTCTLDRTHWRSQITWISNLMGAGLLGFTVAGYGCRYASSTVANQKFEFSSIPGKLSGSVRSLMEQMHFEFQYFGLFSQVAIQHFVSHMITSAWSILFFFSQFMLWLLHSMSFRWVCNTSKVYFAYCCTKCGLETKDDQN